MLDKASGYGLCMNIPYMTVLKPGPNKSRISYTRRGVPEPIKKYTPGFELSPGPIDAHSSRGADIVYSAY